MSHPPNGLRTLLLLCCAALPEAAPAAPDVLLSAVARVRQVDGSHAEIAVERGAVLRTGDEIQLRLVTDRDAYVYVIAYGSSGFARVLHPYSGDDGDARLRARVEQAWPDYDTFLPLDENVGRETLFAVASERPAGDLEPLLELMESHGEDVAAVAREVEAAFPSTVELAFRHIARDALAGVPASTPRKAPAPAPDARGGAPDMDALMESLPADPDAPATSAPSGQSGVLSASGSLIDALTRGRTLPRAELPAPSTTPGNLRPPELPAAEPVPAVGEESDPKKADKPSWSRRLGRLFRFGRKDPPETPDDETAPEPGPEPAPDTDSRAPADGHQDSQARVYAVPDTAAAVSGSSLRVEARDATLAANGVAGSDQVAASGGAQGRRSAPETGSERTTRTFA